MCLKVLNITSPQSAYKKDCFGYSGGGYPAECSGAFNFRYVRAKRQVDISSNLSCMIFRFLIEFAQIYVYFCILVIIIAVNGFNFLDDVLFMIAQEVPAWFFFDL